MALAWSLRGQFGHLKGALIPGVCMALVPAFCMKEEHWRESIGQALMLGALGFAAGGHISYGAFFDAVAHASAFGEVKKEFWHILGVGMVWGALGATFLGFAFSEKKLTRMDLSALGAVVLMWLVFLGVLNQEKWDMILFPAGIFALHGYNYFHKKSSIIWIFTLLGTLAWGAAFLFSAILLSAGYQGYLGTGWTWWVLRDQILGFTAGFIFWGFASGLQDFRFRREPAEKILTVQRAGFLVWMVLVPLLNTNNVFRHWLITRPFSVLWPYIASASVFLLVMGVVVLLRPDTDFLVPKIRKNLSSSALWFTAYMIAIAIGKQWLVMGNGHWEDAYTLFVVFFAVLCLLVPLQERQAR